MKNRLRDETLELVIGVYKKFVGVYSDLDGEGHISVFVRATIQFLEELKAYRIIGTVEECRTAVERMKPRKVVDDEGFGRCPVCDYEFNSELRDEYNISVCLGCYQVLDWSK